MKHPILLLPVVAVCLVVAPPLAAQPWQRHAVDDTSRGADGARLCDVDGDGLLDIVTGWEEAGLIRLYLHPGHAQARQRWPAVTVGQAGSPEDALLVDLDGDSCADVVSCHEGKTRQVLVHWGPRPDEPAVADAQAHALRRKQLLDPASWRTEAIAALDGRLWMFATSIPWGDGAQALVLGSKGTGAQITLLVPPAGDRRRLDAWQAVPLRVAGWIMSLEPLDMDGDADLDLVYSDRKGPHRGIGWLENPGRDTPGAPWTDHAIGGSDMEVMFVDADPHRVLAAGNDGGWLDCRRGDDHYWQCQRHPLPAGLVKGKSIRRLPKASQQDPSQHDPSQQDAIVLTLEAGTLPEHRSMTSVWLHTDAGGWQPIGTPPTGKFDRIECLDLDGDGDADVLTCEERQNLGVVWYENPGLGNLGTD